MSDTPRPSLLELLERLKRFGVPGVSASDQHRSEQVLAIMEQQHEQNSKLVAENVRLSSQKEELRKTLKELHEHVKWSSDCGLHTSNCEPMQKAWALSREQK